VGGGQRKDGEALREIFFQPSSEFGGRLGVLGDEFLEPQFGGSAGGGVEDTADGGGGFGALVEPRHIRLGILLEMELAALPGHGAKDGLAGGGHAGVIVADDELEARQPALDEALKERTPVRLGFTEGDAHAQEGALALWGDAQGDEDGTITQLAVVTDFFIAGITDEVGDLAERSVAPFLEFSIEEFGAGADLGGADGGAAELFDDGGDFAGGDALDVHFGQGKFEGLFGAAAFFEGAGIELQIAADLGDVEGNAAQAGGEGFILEAIGVTFAGVGALVGLGLEGVGAFEAHGLVDQEADAFGQAVGALFGDELQDVVHEFRIRWVGHIRFAVVGVC